MADKSSILNMADKLIFFVNGKKVVEEKPNPEVTLLTYLRDVLKLRGSKLGCGEGGCGACTVMVSKYIRRKDRVIHYAINACLAPVCSMHGLAVTTVEGIGSTKTTLHTIQERIAKSHGSQCGFCTPGIVMSMYALLRSQPHIKYAHLETALQGNLCRCTGYRPILECFKSYIEVWENGYGDVKTNSQNGICGLGDKCCKNKNGKWIDNSNDLCDYSSFKPYDSSQEPIFPPELRTTKKYDEQNLIFRGPNVTWYRPLSLGEVLDIKQKYPEAKIVVGNTEIGVEVKFKKLHYPVLIYPSNIRELMELRVTDDCIVVGSSVTINILEKQLKTVLKHKPQSETGICLALVDMLHRFAGQQIRNVATIGGNIMTSSPISDVNPILMAAGAKLNLVSKYHGHRIVIMNKDFFTSYRQNIIRPDELILSIEIPFTKKFQYFKAFKQSKRRDDDIAIVTAAFNVEFDGSNDKIKDISLAFGGIAPKTVLATETRSELLSENWNEQMLHKALDSLLAEMPLAPSAPGGMSQYRRCLILSLFFKFYLTISEQLSADLHIESKIPVNEISGIEQFKGIMPKSSQYFQVVGDKQVPHDAVGRPMTHVSAMKHATGEAQYCDDIPTMENELHLVLVQSTRAHANILSVDASEALAMPGVEFFFSASDLTEQQNSYGLEVNDEEIFASKTVRCQGVPIGAILAKDKHTAKNAARKVKVVYEDKIPVIVTIEDAIEKNSLFEPCLGFVDTQLMRCGHVDEAFARADHVITGECRTGAQEHFYMETISSMAVPREDNELELFCANQLPSDTASHVASILGIPNNRVVAKVRRIGGGFGGKETRSKMLTYPVAIAAHKLNRPVRAMLERDEDMAMTGNRHPFLIKYEVAFTNEGKIIGAKFRAYSNGGCTLDFSGVVNFRVKYVITNSYNIPNMEVSTYICKTNLPSNTAFRGFGSPQAMLAAETMIRDVADKLKRPFEEIMELNFYKDGVKTHYGQIIKDSTLLKCWNECIDKSNYYVRKMDIEEYNRKNRWKKKGLSVVTTTFGVSYMQDFLMQAGALVLIYMDGSILLSHGGMEMGQGLHTKMIQVASRALDVDCSKIYISETATDKVPNAIGTAASVSSDLNGMAVLNACTVLKERLRPYKEKNPSGKWEDWVAAAHLDRVSLSATGFYASPKIEYNKETDSLNLFPYYSYGAACSEVIIDCLTGDHQVLRTDIVMDVGSSLNPAVDIGQIEGAFIQGYGLYTMEELIYSPQGTLYSRGPGAYKIPGFSDIPVEFNVSLLKDSPNMHAVYSSKGIGEPPLFLASSIFFAIKEAIKDARKDAGVAKKFKLTAPATVEKIRMACEDMLTDKVPCPEPGTFAPWNVAP